MMSTYYFLYTEAVVDGKRICLDGHIKDLERNKLRLSMTYENGSRSYFGEAADEFRRYGYVLKMTDLSDELKEEFPSLLMEDNYTTIIGVDWSLFKSVTPADDEYQLHGWVRKDDLHMFKHDEDMEYIEFVEPEELRNMSPEEKKLIEYYEYDDSMSWEKYFKIIRSAVGETISRWSSVNYLKDLKDIRIVMFIE